MLPERRATDVHPSFKTWPCLGCSERGVMSFRRGVRADVPWSTRRQKPLEGPWCIEDLPLHAVRALSLRGSISPCRHILDLRGALAAACWS